MARQYQGRHRATMLVSENEGSVNRWLTGVSDCPWIKFRSCSVLKPSSPSPAYKTSLVGFVSDSFRIKTGMKDGERSAHEESSLARFFFRFQIIGIVSYPLVSFFITWNSFSLTINFYSRIKFIVMNK